MQKIKFKKNADIATSFNMKFKHLFFALACFTNSMLAQIIPTPMSFKKNEGTFNLPNKIIVNANLQLQSNPAFWELFKGVFPAKIKKFKSKKAHINLIQKTFTSATSNFIKEAYAIDINNLKITIEYADYPGLIHAMMSLKQLQNTSKNTYQCVQITDHPKYIYRGMHLDVSRHFFNTDFIKKYIKMLAFYKYNTFHWHLTDDQGWRIEIKKYPKLTQIGAYRNGSQYGKYSDQTFDNKPNGGFYTHEEIKDVVQFAKNLGITVVPEIEMPGHALAALSAYPEFSCNGGTLLSSLKAQTNNSGAPIKYSSAEITLNRNGDSVIAFKPAMGWGVFDDVFCAGNDQTFEFLQNILDEVIALFPESPYIHIGGDECPKTRWKTCNLCQNRIQTLGLKDEHELQSYFIQRVEKYINSKGKLIIGWDEILEGGLAPNATVMSWRGISGGIDAANQNHHVVMTPGKPCYFDHYQSKDKNAEPVAIGGFNPLDSVFYFNPMPKSLSPDKQKYILGAQANVWTEYMVNDKSVEYMTLPRASALSDALWSERNSNIDLAYKEYLEKLELHKTIWYSWGWYFRP